jgi:hypothetical protein
MHEATIYWREHWDFNALGHGLHSPARRSTTDRRKFVATSDTESRPYVTAYLSRRGWCKFGRSDDGSEVRRSVRVISLSQPAALKSKVNCLGRLERGGAGLLGYQTLSTSWRFEWRTSGVGTWCGENAGAMPDWPN